MITSTNSAAIAAFLLLAAAPDGESQQMRLQAHLDKVADHCAKIGAMERAYQEEGNEHQAANCRRARLALGDGAKEIQEELTLLEFERSFEGLAVDLVPATRREDGTFAVSEIELPDSLSLVTVAPPKPSEAGIEWAPSGAAHAHIGHVGLGYICPDWSVTGSQTLFRESLLVAR